MIMNNDKKTECLRYDKRAQSILAEGYDQFESVTNFGSLVTPPIYRSPYLYYEKCINKYINREVDVLELGSGTGMYTYALKQTGAHVIACDISRHSLEVLSKRIRGVLTTVADMEQLPFEKQSFDVVTSAGSLSYGEPELVDAEIWRVLRPGGIFICVDSLNHNPVYRLNRWLHYIKGERTKSTLLRMPTLSRIQTISKGFENTDIHFFGTASFMMPILARIIGQKSASKVSDAVDRIIRVRNSAFKFVLVARGRL